MTDRELELRLKKAVEACTPDVLDKVMAQCDTYQDVIPLKKRKSQFRQWAALAAAFAVVAGAGLFGYFGMITNRVASIVSLEVNPSIELRINKYTEEVQGKVLISGEKIGDILKLHAKNLKIINVLVNNDRKNIEQDGDILSILDVENGAVEIEIRYSFK